MKTQLKTERYFPDTRCRTPNCDGVVFFGDYCARCEEEIEALEQMSALEPPRRSLALTIFGWTLATALLAWGFWALAGWMGSR